MSARPLLSSRTIDWTLNVDSPPVAPSELTQVWGDGAGGVGALGNSVRCGLQVSCGPVGTS